jgi:hypothetical protein
MDVNRQPGVAIKAFPQGGVVSGKLELRRPVQLKHDIVRRGTRPGQPQERQGKRRG